MDAGRQEIRQVSDKDVLKYNSGRAVYCTASDGSFRKEQDTVAKQNDERLFVVNELTATKSRRR